MTVGELIEELRKFPPYHAVVCEYPGDFDECGSLSVPSLGSILGVRPVQIRSSGPAIVIEMKGLVE